MSQLKFYIKNKYLIPVLNKLQTRLFSQCILSRMSVACLPACNKLHNISVELVNVYIDINLE